MLIAVGILPACATKRDVRELQETIRELHAQNQAMLREIQDEQQDQEDTLSTLAQSLQESRAEASRRMMNIEDQLLTVQELTGLSQQQLASLRDQYERDRQRSFGPPTTFGAPGAAGPGGSGTAGDLFNTALTAFQRQTYSAARSGFQQIVDQFGSDPLAPEARYYLAEIRYNEGDTEGAVEAFLEIPEFHPTADRVPQALYRAGMLSLELGDADEARELFQRVVNTWPDSDAAALARVELRDL